jgi:methionine biosynthesis protein MetW
MPEIKTDQPDNHPEIYRWILAHTPLEGKILDIGCGDGELLNRMVQEKRVQGTGIELSQESAIRAIQRGLTVHHGNVEEGLDHYGDQCFDLVVLSLTLQETRQPRKVLEESFRVGRRIIVVFPNFAHWRARLQLACHGRAPRTEILPYPWYESPNYHYMTIADWEDFCQQEDWKICAVGYAASGQPVGFLPRWRAEVAMYLLEG